MFAAIGRLLRAIWYAITFQFVWRAEAWEKNPAVINATYDSIQKEQLKRIDTLKSAVAGQLRYKIGREKRLKDIAAHIDEKERGMKGALKMAQARVEALRAAKPGISNEDVQNDPEYVRCQKGYQDFKSTLDTLRSEVTNIEKELKKLEQDEANSETALESALRELDAIKQERHATITDAELAQQRKEVADLKTGIATNGKSEERQRMQEMRAKLNAEATVAERLAGIDETKATQEFLAYAEKSEAANEFDQLLGVAAAADKSVEAVEVTPSVKQPLPEN